jgi:hypothetical protein
METEYQGKNEKNVMPWSKYICLKKRYCVRKAQEKYERSSYRENCDPWLNDDEVVILVKRFGKSNDVEKLKSQ